MILLASGFILLCPGDKTTGHDWYATKWSQLYRGIRKSIWQESKPSETGVLHNIHALHPVSDAASFSQRRTAANYELTRPPRRNYCHRTNTDHVHVNQHEACGYRTAETIVAGANYAEPNYPMARGLKIAALAHPPDRGRWYHVGLACSFFCLRLGR